MQPNSRQCAAQLVPRTCCTSSRPSASRGATVHATTSSAVGWRSPASSAACSASTTSSIRVILKLGLHGDVFRLGFYLALLIGAAREIASYWTSSLAAASLEERRRLRARRARRARPGNRLHRPERPAPPRSSGAEPQLVDRILGSVNAGAGESGGWSGASAGDRRTMDKHSRRRRGTPRDATACSVEWSWPSGIVLSPGRRDAVIRIASEAVANAAQHSGAEARRIYLERADAGMRLGVEDDGSGFNEEQPQRGFGLVNHQRTAPRRSAGKLRIDSPCGAEP